METLFQFVDATNLLVVNDLFGCSFIPIINSMAEKISDNTIINHHYRHHIKHEITV